MKVIDKLVTEWAYRCKKGYPDMNNPDDLKILKEIYSEYGIVFEAENQEKDEEEQDTLDQPKPQQNTRYDEIILHALGMETIPAVEGTYKLSSAHGVLDVAGHHDKSIFAKLYKIAPPKAKEEVGSAGSKGSGHGELAVYWLLKYQKQGYNVQDSRGGSSADLLVNGEGVEVKAYAKSDVVALGRVGKYTTELTNLNTVFAVSALITEFSGESRKKLPPNAIHLTSSDLLEASNQLIKVSNMQDLRQVKIPFIVSMFTKIDEVLSKYDNPTDGKVLAAHLLRALLKAKFLDKPIGSGNAGYIMNVSPTGTLEYTYITRTALDSLDLDKVFSGVKLNQGIIYFNKTIFN